jgi:hypothetical protein
MLRFVPLLLWAWAVPVSAEEASAEGRFSFEIKSCPTVPAQSVRRILGIEVGDLLLAEGEALTKAPDRLSIRCVGHFARIEAAGPSVTTPYEQVVDLEAFPEDAAARALALAGLELLSAMNVAVRARLGTQPPSPTPPVAVPALSPPPKAAQAPAPVLRDTRLGLVGTWRTFLPDRGASLWGGKVEASTMLAALWMLAADVEVAGGRDHLPGLGDVDALSFSSALSFGARFSRRTLGGSLGVGGRFGLIRLAGKSANATAVSASSGQHPWGGPVATACAWSRFGRFSLMLSAEAGYSFLAFDGLAGDKTAVSVGGPWIGIGLGGGFHL